MSVSPIPPALVCDLTRVLNSSDLKVSIPKFLANLGKALLLSRSASINRSGLRLSSLGKEPIIVALNNLGIVTESTDNKCNQFTLILGYLFESYATALIETELQSRLSILECGPVKFEGVSGNVDLLVETKRGLRIVIEFKCISSSVVRDLLEPETKENPYTGNKNRTGEFLPKLSQYALDNDHKRGYVSQLATYVEAAKADGGILVLFDKGANKVRVVPLDTLTHTRATRRSKETLNACLQCSSLADVFARFEAPALIPQKSGGKPTGQFYLPDSVRYINPDILDLLYDENPAWDGLDTAYMYLSPRNFEVSPIKDFELAFLESLQHQNQQTTEVK